MDIYDSQIGDLISEGKTKQVFCFKNLDTINGQDELVYITNKDNISAGDNSRNRRIMEGKGRITVETSSAIFKFLNAVGVKTAFISRDKNSNNSFVAKHCEMIPIELVIRRLATGTYLKLNPEVSEGFKFISPVVEIHIKDDKNHDPLWSIETLIAQKFIINGLLVDKELIEIILKLSKLIFEILERVWHSIDYQLVDLKVEFGIICDQNHNRRLVLADIIDNETWRLWPNADKRLMVDKQIYRVYTEGEVDQKIIENVKNVFQKVSDLTQNLFGLEKHKFGTKFLDKEPILVLVNSKEQIVLAENFCKRLETDFNIIGANIVNINEFKENSVDFQELINKINQSYYEVIVAIGVKSSVISSNTVVPIVEYKDNYENNILSVAKILAINNTYIWSVIRTSQFYNNLSVDWV